MKAVLNTSSTRSPRYALKLAAAFGVAVAGLSTNAMADATWLGTTGTNWNDGTNWSTNPPDGNFIINTTGGTHPVLGANSAFLPADIFVGSGAGNAGQFDHTAGLLTMTSNGEVDHGGAWYMVGVDNGTGTLNMSGSSTISVGKLQAGGAYYRPGGTGTININTTGTLAVNSDASFGYLFGGSAYASIALGVSDFSGLAATGTMNIQNGTVNAYGETHVGSHGGTGTLNMTGGTLNTRSLVLARWRGTGTANITNSTLNAGSVNLSFAGAANDVEVGTMNVGAGGVVNSEGDTIVAFAGSGDSVATLNVNAGATVNVGTTVERWLIVSQYDAIQGVVNVNGGTINLNAETDLRFSTGGNTGAGVVNLNSGAINAYSGNKTGASTASVVDLNQSGGATVNNTFNLNGGTLSTNQITASVASGTRTVNFNGGTLVANADSADFVNNLTTANVRNGGAVINTAGHAVTINQTLVHSTVAGDNATDGGVNKTGAGTLTLTGANTYTGATTVSAGKLVATTPAYTNFLSNAGGVRLAPGGVLTLDYTGGTSPVAGIRATLTAEYPSGFTTGQIRPTATLATGRTIGYGDNGTGNVTVMVTLAGDANLSGGVDFNDFLVLQNNYNKTGTRFDQGNFNYDNTTDFNDFLVLQNNFGKTLGGTTLAFTSEQIAAITAFASNPTAAVPEPAALGLIAAAGLFLRRRRA